MFDLLVTILFFYGVYRLFRYLKAPVQKPRHNIPISGPGHHYNNSTNRLNIEAYTEDDLHGHRCYIDKLTSYEYALVKELSRNLDPNAYYLFNNVTVPCTNTTTSQIDHIVVSRFGIFVIESKDYSGWIFGSKNQKQWTQVFKNGNKFRFQNPILQNFSHVVALKEHLPFLKKSFFNVVVFSEESEFKTELPINVMSGHELVRYIDSKTKTIISEGELLMAIGKLSVLCQTVQVSNEEHVQNLGKKHKLARSVTNISIRNKCISTSRR